MQFSIGYAWCGTAAAAEHSKFAAGKKASVGVHVLVHNAHGPILVQMLFPASVVHPLQWVASSCCVSMYNCYNVLHVSVTT
jgi:hypothetical protein